MAVAFVAPAYSAESSSVGSVNGAAGDLIIVFVTYRRSTSTETCSGATYDGTPMTRIGSDTYGGNSDIGQSAFYTLNPEGTSVTVAATVTGSPASAQISALVFSGADGIGTESFIGTTGIGATAYSRTVTSETDGMVVDCWSMRWPDGSTETAGQTERTTLLASSSVSHQTSTKAGAASVQMEWTAAGSGSYTHFAVPISPAAAATVRPKFLAARRRRDS